MSQWLEFSHLTPVVRLVLLGVFAVLLVASTVSIALIKLKPQKNWSELRARIRTWWVIAGLVAGSLLLSPQAAIWFFALVSFLALKEFFSLIPTRRANQRLSLGLRCYSRPICVDCEPDKKYGMFIIFVPVYLFLLLPTRMILIGETKGFTGHRHGSMGIDGDRLFSVSCNLLVGSKYRRTSASHARVAR